MRRNLSMISRILLVSLPLLLLSIAALAQNMVTGRVTDVNGNPAGGVTVTIKGTGTAVQTATDGTYRINAASNATLVFSSVGFASQEAAVSGRSSVDISLAQANQQLNEVVVVAYGTRRRGDLTGAVTSVSAKDFQKGNINSSEQLLQGKVAGLQVTNGGGSPGGGSRLRIRGAASLFASNDPLVVIDGVPVEGNGIAGNDNILATINPNDIESMSVLKDASATALYGSRASNGVIIITTKKGSKGKIRYNFNTQLSVGTVAKKVDVLTGDEIREIINADALATGNNTYKNLLGTANTDWQNAIYQEAFGNDNNLSATGALGILPFRASVGYTTQQGLLRTDKFNRFSSSLNLSPKFFNDGLSVNLNLKASSVKRHKADGGAVGAAASFDPTQSNDFVQHNKNKFGNNFEWINAGGSPINTNGGSVQPNPVSLLDYKHDEATTNRFIGNLQLDYKLPFFPDLHAQINVGIDKTSLTGEYRADSVLVSEYRPASRGKRSPYKESKQNTLLDLSLFYTKEIKSIKTKLDALLLHSYQDFYTNVYTLPSYATGRDTIIPAVITYPTDKPQYRLESYLGRVNLTVDNKYLLTASLRRDASSKFSKDNRVGYFPAVAAAWKLKDEFFPSSNLLTDLKLRVGWGVTGQQDGIDYYGYLPKYSLSSNGGAQYQFGDTFYTFSRPAAYDPNIKWETTTTTNIGLDFAFLNNRISGTVDFYMKKTKDLLSIVPVASGANFNVELLTNVGDLENKGIEFTLNTVPVKTRDLTWDFGFNVAYNKTEITKLLAQQDANFKGIAVSSVNDTKVGRHFVGYTPYSFYVSKQVYDPATGRPIEGLYEDLNRDGTVDDKDVYFYKKPAPDVTLGVSTQLTYKKYSLGLAGHGSFGNYVYNQYNALNGLGRSMKNPLNFIGNVSRDYLNTRFENTRYISDYYIENASFFRLDNINLGYNFGKILRNRASLRLGASVQNVFVITKYSGVDPENSSNEGLDNTIYPRPRIYSLNLNLDF